VAVCIMRGTSEVLAYARRVWEKREGSLHKLGRPTGHGGARTVMGRRFGAWVENLCSVEIGAPLKTKVPIG